MKSHLLALACVVALPSVAHADVTPVEEDRLVLTGGFGAGGSVEIELSEAGIFDGPVSDDTNAGGTLGIQYEAAIASYFVLAGRFGFTRYDWEEGTDRNRTFLDFDVVPMLTFGIEAGPIILEPRVSVPFGLSLNMWNAEDDLNNYDGIGRTNVGFNFGGLGGVLVRPNRGGDFFRSLGATLEMGFMQHRAYAEGDNTGWNYQLRLNQFVMQAGIAIALR